MNKKRGRKVLEYFGIIVYFLGLLSFFWFIYQSKYSCFHDSYGLSRGTKEHIIIQNFWDILDFIFITSVNMLFMFLGEKASVIIGYQIVVRMINCLLLFVAFSVLTRKKLLSFIVTTLYAIAPLLLFRQYNYDGMLILELILIIVFFLFSIIFSIVRGHNKTENQILSQNVENVIQTFNQDTMAAEINNSAQEDAKMIAVDRIDNKNNIQKEAFQVMHTQFIENPLPVPKKHIRKEMTYDIEVADDKMNYDILQPIENYFDIE